MASKVRITDQKELEDFVKTHLDHRLTALVAPIFDDANAYRIGRGDISKAAQEGSYVMLRLFIEFLGVKGQENKSNPTWTLEKRSKLPKKKPGKDIQETDLLLSCFSDRKGNSLHDLRPTDFGKDQEFIAKIHRTLCKINAHFTYDDKKARFYDRIASLPRPDLEKAVEIVVSKLDQHFYQKVGLDIIVHGDLREQFKKRFTGVKSNVKSN
jgi:hypothetical protein